MSVVAGTFLLAAGCVNEACSCWGEAKVLRAAGLVTRVLPTAASFQASDRVCGRA